MAIPSTVPSYKIVVDGSAPLAKADPGKKEIHVHPLLQVDPADIPPTLRLSGPDDPRINDFRFMALFEQWLSKAHNIPLSKLKNFEPELRLILEMWQQPKLLKRMQQFAIAHEIGHIAMNHSSFAWEVFFAAALTITLYVLLLPGEAAILISIPVGFVSYKIFHAMRLFSLRHQEVEADRYALKLTGDQEAGTALLECLERAKAKAWGETSFLSKITTTLLSPEKVFPIAHPSPHARIAALENEDN